MEIELVKNKILQGDALDILKQIKDESIDLILTDPPYMISSSMKIARGRNYKYKGKDISADYGRWDKQWKNKEEYIEWCKLWWRECIRILKPYRHFLFFFDKAKISYAWDFMEEHGMKARSPLYWIKCLSGDTKIIIKDGTSIKEIKLENLEKEDLNKLKILTPNGFKRIISIQKNKGFLFEIDTDVGRVLATANHKFPCLSHWYPRERILLKSLDSIMKLKHYPYLLFYKDGFQGNREKILNFELNYELGWIIGLFVAEGNYNKNTQIRFSLNKKRMNIIEELKNILKNSNFFNSKTQPNGIKVHRFIKRNSLAVYFGSKRVKELFQTIVFGKGAKGKRLNNSLILSCNKEFREGLLQGILDGAGSLWKKENYMKLTLANHGLIEDIQLLAFSLGKMTSIRDYIITNQTNKRFPVSILTFRRPKISICIENEKFVPVRIKNIRPYSEGTVYDIAVEGKYFICNRGIIVHNSNPVPRARKVDFMKAVEMILWFTKKAVKQDYFNWQLGQAKDYVFAAIPHNPRYHPTQKAEKPLAQIISYLSKQGDLVLDPFIGSGTTAVVAKKLNRHFLGIELDPEYVAIAKKRISNIASSLPMQY